MKTIAKNFALFVLALFLFSCQKDEFGLAIGNGPVETEVREITEISAVDLRLGGDVYLQKGPQYSVQVSAPKNLLDNITTRVSGKTLTIDNRRQLLNTDKIKLVVTAPSFEAVTIQGSGDIFAQDVLEAPTVDLKIDGSGDLHGTVKAEKLTLEIRGSGEMILSGSATDCFVRVKGSGDVKGRDLVTKNTEVQVAGSGDVTMTVSDWLKGKISGSGDVRYLGSPRVEVEVSGSGDLQRL